MVDTTDTKTTRKGPATLNPSMVRSIGATLEHVTTSLNFKMTSQKVRKFCKSCNFSGGF